MGREDTSFGSRWRDCFVLASLLATAAPAYAQAPNPVRVVRWTAPLECPTEADTVDEIERLLGRELDPSAVAVRGVIERGEAGFTLELTLEQGEVESRRQLSDPSCESVTRAGALVIALAIDPTVLASLEPEPEPEPEETPEQGADPDEGTVDREPGEGDAPEVESEAGGEADGGETEPNAGEPREEPEAPGTDPEASEARRALRAPDEPPSEASSSEPPAPRFVGQLFGALSLGPLPSATPGGGLAAGFGYDALELVLGAYAVAPQEGLLDNSTSGGTVGLAAGRLRGCASFEAADALLEVLPCASLEVGAAWATGVGVPIARTGLAPWVSVGAGARLRVWFLDAVGLEAFADLQVPLLRAPFVLTLGGERREFHRAFEVGGLFGLGIAVRLR